MLRYPREIQEEYAKQAKKPIAGNYCIYWFIQDSRLFFSGSCFKGVFFILYYIRNPWNLIGSKHCDCSQITKFLQIWAPQSIELTDLTAKLERIQSLAIRFILNLPYSSTISYNILVYRTLNLLPVCYWDELLDLIFFFKVTHCFVNVTPLSYLMFASTDGLARSTTTNKACSRFSQSLFSSDFVILNISHRLLLF